MNLRPDRNGFVVKTIKLKEHDLEKIMNGKKEIGVTFREILKAGILSIAETKLPKNRCQFLKKYLMVEKL